MVRLMINNWWLILLRGVLALAFSIFIVFLEPLFPSTLLKAMAYTALAVIFGLFASGTGAITIVAALKGAQKRHGSWLMLSDGVVETSAGLLVLLIPTLNLAEVIYIIAATAGIAGVLELVAGTHLRRHVTDEWLLIAVGMVSIAFSAFLFLAGTRDIASLLNWVALYAAAIGCFGIGLAFRLRSLRHSIHTLSEHAMHPSPSTSKRPGTA